MKKSMEINKLKKQGFERGYRRQIILSYKELSVLHHFFSHWSSSKLKESHVHIFHILKISYWSSSSFYVVDIL